MPSGRDCEIAWCSSFTNMGLQNTATGTFESAAVPRAQAAAQLANVLQAIANPQQFPDVDRICELKHLWMYIDRAELGA
jgi:hypothetical protein